MTIGLDVGDHPAVCQLRALGWGPSCQSVSRGLTGQASGAQVRVAFLSLLTALVKGEELAATIWRQMAAWGASTGLYQMLSWRTLFDSLVQYCRKYNAVLGAAAASGRMVVFNREEQLMNSADAQAVVAYLRLFRSVGGPGGRKVYVLRSWPFLCSMPKWWLPCTCSCSCTVPGCDMEQVQQLHRQRRSPQQLMQGSLVRSLSQPAVPKQKGEEVSWPEFLKGSYS